jgi:hypothetical protein
LFWRFLLCAWVPNRTFSATLAFPGRYLLTAPHELFPTMGRGWYGCKGVDDALEAYRYRNRGE